MHKTYSAQILLVVVGVVAIISLFLSYIVVVPKWRISSLNKDTDHAQGQVINKRQMGSLTYLTYSFDVPDPIFIYTITTEEIVYTKSLSNVEIGDKVTVLYTGNPRFKKVTSQLKDNDNPLYLALILGTAAWWVLLGITLGGNLIFLAYHSFIAKEPVVLSESLSDFLAGKRQDTA